MEVGAHNGSDTESINNAVPGCILHAFEPVAENFKQLSNRKLGNNVHINNIAVVVNSGTIEFILSSNSYSGSIKPPLDHKAVYPDLTFCETPITVPLVSIDDYCQNHGIKRIDFIWADLQGAEADLIKGAKSMISRINYIYTEYNERELYLGAPNLSQILDLLPNFRVLRRFHGDVLLMNTRPDFS